MKLMSAVYIFNFFFFTFLWLHYNNNGIENMAFLKLLDFCKEWDHILILA